MDEEHTCEVYVEWKKKKKGIISFLDDKKGEIEFSVPPEFMGHQHIVTPEDLFLSSLLTCLDAYFFNMAARTRLKFTSFRSCAKSKIVPIGPDYIFSKIDINVYIGVKDERDAHKAERAMNIAEKGCYVANSIKPKVKVKKHIKIEKKED